MPFNASDVLSGRRAAALPYVTLQFRICSISMMEGEVVMKISMWALGLALGLSGGAALAQTAAEREACQADFKTYCPNVQPGGGRVVECLSKHLDQLTPQCKTVVEANMPK
jgi:hypothetical protein